MKKKQKIVKLTNAKDTIFNCKIVKPLKNIPENAPIKVGSKISILQNKFAQSNMSSELLSGKVIEVVYLPDNSFYGTIEAFRAGKLEQIMFSNKNVKNMLPSIAKY